jgi:hypothetical protein
VQLTASKELRDKLERARDLMRHRHPEGDLSVILEHAVDLLLAKLEKERLGKTSRPQRAKTSEDAGYVSRATRREVVERDGAQCSFVSTDGERCPSTAFLEFDHRTPRAFGGTGDASNVRVLCRAHNLLAAERIFGRERIDLFRNKCGRSAEANDQEESTRKDRLRSALRHLGFRSTESERALAALDRRGWDAPIESLVRDAVGLLRP